MAQTRRRRRGPGRRRPLRVLAGIAAMVAAVAIGLVILGQFAGNWGVPYFSFTSDRGSGCVNRWAGYSCDQLTTADVNWWGDVSLPTTSTVVTGQYVATHDYALNAEVAIPRAQAASGLTALKKSFGDCVEDRPAPMDTRKLKDVCVMADDLSDAGGEDPGKASRLYTVGTGLRADGVRIVVLDVHSR